MVNLYTKFQMPSITHSTDEGVPKFEKMVTITDYTAHLR